ncbi:MAG TPA: hypothetical protein VFX60_17160 [Micromonospora sp.]|nr:hypothetical protein [Micromonospora sp.]
MTDAERVAAQRQRRAQRRQTRRPGQHGERGSGPVAIVAEPMALPLPAGPGTVADQLAERQREALARLVRATTA